MALTAVASDTPTSLAPSPSVLRRLWSAIMRAREAQAQLRLESELRDLPDDVLKDIGLARNGANSRATLHLG
jgi:uncharacterized protein YjiS (DUF1127 family)